MPKKETPMKPKHWKLFSIYTLLVFSIAACKQPEEQTTNSTPPGVAYFVIQSEDDAEEGSKGQVVFDNDDLDLGQAAGFESAVSIGIRFQNIHAFDSSVIKGAFLQFTADGRGVKDEPTELTLRGELSGDADSFKNEPKNISSRKLTRAAVKWSPDTWREGDGRGKRQQSPDLSAVIQEVLDQDGWEEGNALAIIITGNGERDAMSFDGGGMENGPALFIETN